MLNFFKNLFQSPVCPVCGSDEIEIHTVSNALPGVKYFVNPGFKTIITCNSCGYGKNRLASKNNMSRNSFIDNVFRDKVTPRPGSVLICNLSPAPILCEMGICAEHSGIYVGDNMIIHRDGDGYIARVDSETFLKRLDGFNWALFIYVACIDKEPFASERAVENAIAALNDPKQKGYDLLNKNCHHFTNYCLTGDPYAGGLFDFTFSNLQNLLINEFSVNNWRIWDQDSKC